MDGGSDTGSIPVYSTRRKCCKRLFYGTFSFSKGFKNAILDRLESKKYLWKDESTGIDCFWKFAANKNR